ncbi:hypothetical protein ACH4U6_27370 [Streptomyces netropsis]|uniref:hypothetical protein n=1 Tax=Streptomyces netropsis TaxID=55404 RepID=UPI0037B42715
MPAGQAQIATEPGVCRTITLEGIPILTFHHRTTMLAAVTTAVLAPVPTPCGADRSEAPAGPAIDAPPGPPRRRGPRSTRTHLVLTAKNASDQGSRSAPRPR